MPDMLTDTGEGAAALERRARQLETLDRLAQRFGRSLDGAMSAGSAGGRELSGVLDKVASALSSSLGRGLGSAVESTLSTAVQSMVRGLTASASFTSFGGALPFAKGGVVPGGVVPFAAGGVVASPTYFPLGRGLGVMGEAGAEAVMPLARGPDGRLGVRAAGRGGSNVTVNIAAADVESFRRSEAQVSAALARAVARGRRAL